MAANRLNAQKRRGPRTSIGKMRASRNATILHTCVKIEDAAKALSDGDSNPELFEQALIIAENDLLLRSVRTHRVVCIERLRDVTAIALVKGDNALDRATARRRVSELAWKRTSTNQNFTRSESR